MIAAAEENVLYYKKNVKGISFLTFSLHILLLFVFRF